MNWQFYLIVGGSIALALFITWLGRRQDKKEEAASSKG
jgi:hypothetical protein